MLNHCIAAGIWFNPETLTESEQTKDEMSWQTKHSMKAYHEDC